MTEKSNLELAREAGIESGGKFITKASECDIWYGDLNTFAALVEQRYRERLLGVKVEPVPESHDQSVSYRNGWNACRANYADQCAAMVQQALDRVRLP